MADGSRSGRDDDDRLEQAIAVISDHQLALEAQNKTIAALVKTVQRQQQTLAALAAVVLKNLPATPDNA